MFCFLLTLNDNAKVTNINEGGGYKYQLTVESSLHLLWFFLTLLYGW